MAGGMVGLLTPEEPPLSALSGPGSPTSLSFFFFFSPAILGSKQRATTDTGDVVRCGVQITGGLRAGTGRWEHKTTKSRTLNPGAS